MSTQHDTDDIESLDWAGQRVAVLVSGGLDSAILLGELAQKADHVTPIYVRFGLFWETVEERMLRRFLAELDATAVQPLQTFSLPIAEVYGNHWSTTGQDVPPDDSADEAVFLPGRNILLLAQPAIWCHRHGIDHIAMAPLAANPFPDSDVEFFSQWQAVLNRALNARIRIVLPYRGRSKPDVLRRGRDFPLRWTLSCIAPVDDRHCGHCNKCGERKHAFAAAGLDDPTEYHQPPE